MRGGHFGWPAPTTDHDAPPLPGRHINAQRVPSLIGHRPDMARICLLIARITRLENLVLLPLPLSVDPEDFDHVVGVIFEVKLRLGSPVLTRPRVANRRKRWRLKTGARMRSYDVRRRIQLPHLSCPLQKNRARHGFEIQRLDREMIGCNLLSHQLCERGSNSGMIERRLSNSLFRIHQHKFPPSVEQIDAVPETRVMGEPVRLDPVALDASGTVRRARRDNANHRQHDCDGYGPRQGRPSTDSILDCKPPSAHHERPPQGLLRV